MRWLLEAWEGARSARTEGCDVRAVTAWALFGSWGWESLVIRQPFSYECGAFDTRSYPPRPTALAEMIRSLASKGSYSHPAAQSPGWWRDDERLYHRSPELVGQSRVVRMAPTPTSSDCYRPILVVGATGTLGRALVSACAARGLHHIALGRRELDITDADEVSRVIQSLQPWAVINAAGYVKVDDAEREPGPCFQGNAAGPANLAEWCARSDIRFVTFSTDLVFDGERTSPYTEDDGVRPLNVYGLSKALAEVKTLRRYPSALVIRTSAFFSPNDDFNFLICALRSIAEGIPVCVAHDAIVSPTYVPDLANAALDLVIDGEAGVWHVANAGETSWADFAVEGARRAGLDQSLIVPVPLHDAGRPARMPRYSALSSHRGKLLPSLDDALDRFISEANLPLARAEATC